MPDRDGRPKLTQRLGVVIFASIGARHPVPRREEEPGDAAHPGSADADEMKRTQLSGQLL